MENLAVAGNITVTNTIQGQGNNTDTTQKSLVGGGSGTTVGTITNGGSILNIGSGNGQIDVVSPGIALQPPPCRMVTTKQQLIVGDHDDLALIQLAKA